MIPQALETDIEAIERRGFLRAAVRICTGCVAAGAAAVLASAAGAAALTRAAIGPSLTARAPRWIRASRLDELETNVPTPVTLRITRQDGYLETVDQQVVFLVRTDKQEIRALSSTCAHLGCSVSFNREKEQFVCPCHDGVFDLEGRVVAGPPPKPLERLQVRVENARVHVQV